MNVVCVVTVTGVFGPGPGVALTLIVLVPYVALLSARPGALSRLPLPRRWLTATLAAVAEEESELSVALRPRPGTAVDALVAAVALAVVVASSVVMERAATSLG